MENFHPVQKHKIVLELKHLIMLLSTTFCSGKTCKKIDLDKGNSFLLVIPEKYEPIIFNRYHHSLLAGATYQTSIGQQYTNIRINPSSQSNNRIQLRTLQPQLHPQRLRDHQVATLDPKQSSNLPSMSRDNRNAILHQWTHQNAIQLKLRSTQ